MHICMCIYIYVCTAAYRSISKTSAFTGEGMYRAVFTLIPNILSNPQTPLYEYVYIFMYKYEFVYIQPHQEA
jgi:hypothetical protein